MKLRTCNECKLVFAPSTTETDYFAPDDVVIDGPPVTWSCGCEKQPGMYSID
jgi:hypothetical protein